VELEVLKYIGQVYDTGRDLRDLQEVRGVPGLHKLPAVASSQQFTSRAEGEERGLDLETMRT